MANEALKAKLQQIDANDTQIGSNDAQIGTNDLEIKGQVNALRQYGMGVTGIQRDRLGDVVYDLADGYGGGGGGDTDDMTIDEGCQWLNSYMAVTNKWKAAGKVTGYPYGVVCRVTGEIQDTSMVKFVIFHSSEYSYNGYGITAGGELKLTNQHPHLLENSVVHIKAL